MAKSQGNPSSSEGKASEAESSAIQKLFEGQAAKSTESGVFLQPVGSTDTNPFSPPGTQQTPDAPIAEPQASTGTDASTPSSPEPADEA